MEFIVNKSYFYNSRYFMGRKSSLKGDITCSFRVCDKIGSIVMVFFTIKKITLKFILMKIFCAFSYH